MITTIDELQALVRSFNEARGWRQKHVPAQLAQAISIEAAELLECYLWRTHEASTAETLAEGEFRTRVESEVADIAIYLLSFCDRTGIALDAVVRSKLAVNEERFVPHSHP